MIHVEQLDFAYGKRPIFKDLDFEISSGEILSLLGPNGCGKSTFLKLMRGVLTPDRGDIIWDGQRIGSISRREMAKKVAVVAQSNEVYFSYTVRELVSMGRFPHRPLLAELSRDDYQKVDDALKITDVDELAERPATDLSGGELQRVMLARALAQQTPVLLLDEATSHLDLVHRLDITDLLVQLNKEQGRTIVQVSHDLDLAAEISHRILLFSADGRIAALGAPLEVVTSENIKAVFGVDVEIVVNEQTGAPRIVPLRPARL